jgi:RecA/RadA recombinase
MPTALELLDTQPAPAVLPTGLPGLDALLSGGLWCGEVAELCGGAPCGKSSVALAAAAAALLARASATVLLIATTQDRHGVRLRGLLAAPSPCSDR